MFYKTGPWRDRLNTIRTKMGLICQWSRIWKCCELIRWRELKYLQKKEDEHKQCDQWTIL